MADYFCYINSGAIKRDNVIEDYIQGKLIANELIYNLTYLK